MGATDAASRVRLMLEGTGTIQLSNGGRLESHAGDGTPVQLGVRIRW